MKTEDDPALFPRIVLAMVIIFASGLFWSIGRMLFTEGQLGFWGKGYLFSGAALAFVGLIYVVIQRFEMGKKEKFRREKW